MDPVSKAQATPQSRRFLKGGHSPDIGRATRFPPGQSANPGGRPKHSISKIYRQWLKKARNRKKIEDFLDATIEGQSKMAGVLLIREMTERDEGKVADVVDMNVSGTLSLEQVLEARKKAKK
jgi:hypothetical protein